MATSATDNIRPGIKALFFDVYGTCAAQRTPVADELWRAAQEALNAESSSINDEVRAIASKSTYDDWFDFGGKWNAEEGPFRRSSIERTGTVDWKAVDEHRINILPHMLADRGLIILEQPSDHTAPATAAPGSLWTTAQLQHLGKIWHRLTPWSDTNRGLHLLNRKYTTVALSNTHTSVLHSLASHTLMPFQHLLSADLFGSYKPNPKVYLSAAQRIGVKPEECAMVAAHLDDLKAAKACGFYAIYVERELEEKTPELRKEGIPDLMVGLADGGLAGLAERLGCVP